MLLLHHRPFVLAHAQKAIITPRQHLGSRILLANITASATNATASRPHHITPSSPSADPTDDNDVDVRDEPETTVVNVTPVVETTPTGVRLTAHMQYHAVRLARASLPSEPLTLFRTWLADALSTVREPEAMTLCTSTRSGVPSARTVLLKEVDDKGLVFFTNYSSRKGAELDSNPNAALALHWRELMRQVRVIGPVEKVSRAESEAYFATRPRGSQVGAWASAQSSVVGEGELEAAVAKAKARFEGQDSVPCPPGWGGYRVIPT